METIANWLSQLHPILQGAIGGTFAWALTAVGAMAVFVFRNLDRKTLDTMLGFTGGVMLAASFWSLLNPAIEMCEATMPKSTAWIPVGVGFVLGALFLFALDQYLPHLHINAPVSEGIKTDWNRTILLVLAITLHNIPEGLAIGVAFGAVAEHLPDSTMLGAIALTIGIGIQDFPEGLAVAVPLRRSGLSRRRSFFWGQLSGLVEPLAAMLGVALVMLAKPILPYALAFAAGAMIYVVVEEVIPETQRERNTDLATLGLIAGFVLMMALDVGLG